MGHDVRPAGWFAQLSQNLCYYLKSATVFIWSFYHSQHVVLPLRKKQAIFRKNSVAMTRRHTFPAIDVFGMAYKDEGRKAAFLPSLLLLSAASSSSLMTLRSITPGTLDGFSAGILVSAHVLSPHLSIVNSVLPK